MTDVLTSAAAMYCDAGKVHSAINEWANACCDARIDAATSGVVLYASYAEWSKAQSLPVCTERAFLLFLAKCDLGRVNRYGKRYWLGLHIKGGALKPIPRPRSRQPKPKAPARKIEPPPAFSDRYPFPPALVEDSDDDSPY